MCGIIGFSGKQSAAPILLDGLQQLEYRGYDSAGISLLNESGSISTIKTAGKVSDLREKVSEEQFPEAYCGIGHTRWATHGGVTDINAHPHTVGQVTLIHNGIIENYNELAANLAKLEKYPVSQTDTEIATMLIENLYTGDPIAAIREAVSMIEGAYAFCIMFSDQPGKIYSIRNASPLVATYTKDGAYIASDMTALVKYSKDYFVIPEQHIVKLSANAITLMTLEGNNIRPKMLHVNWDVKEAKKNGYSHYMLKEIYDQPESLLSTISPRLIDGMPDFSEEKIPTELFTGLTRIIITACGTAMNAGLVGKSIIEKLLRISVSVEIASEFRYQDPILDSDTLVIVISQSGETADSLAALRLANHAGARTLSLVNVKGSSIARESNYVLYTHAGPEIAVASTKAFTVQVAGLYLITAKLLQVKGYTLDQQKAFTNHLYHTADYVKETLKLDCAIEELSNCLTETYDCFFIGRGNDYSIACEGSLKLKEVSYIHSEAYVAGELKHGPIALITKKVPVIAIATQEKTFAKLISNIREVKARGSQVILITTQNVDAYTDVYDHLIQLPDTPEEFAPFTAAVAVQLLAYYASVHRGLDVDQPRNLAKSVTVE